MKGGKKTEQARADDGRASENPVSAASLLRAARALIERRECWYKGDYGDHETGAWDAAGAFMQAMCDRAVQGSRRVRELAWRCLTETLPKDHGIEQFNDAPERTHEEVLALYDRAIAMAERLTIR